MLFEMFSPPLWKMPNFMFCISKRISFYHPPFTISLDMLTSCYWLMTSALWLMFHYQSHMNKFGFVWCFISQGRHNHGYLGKGKTSPRLAPNGCVFPLCHRGIWLLVIKNGWFFHQCANMVWLAKGTSGPPLVVLHVFL